MPTTRSSRSVSSNNVRASSGQQIPPGYSDATAKYFEQLERDGGEEVGVHGIIRTRK
ncbi:MAG: hypothetical protein WDO73_15550 [Ignavibacteriota bacterium]